MKIPLPPLLSAILLPFSTLARLLAIAAFLSVLSVPAAGADPKINTLAGGGPVDIAATATNLPSPTGLARDEEGNLYVAAPDLNRVFKIDTAGRLTVAAGNGFPGLSPDGVVALEAFLPQITALGVDRNGNLFLADSAHVRKVDAATGILTTVAGGGNGGDGSPAGTAYLSGITSVALDPAGNLYVLENSPDRVRRVDAMTGLISTIAGTGPHGFSGDGGPATSARLNFPRGLTVDTGGNLWIADTNNLRVRRVDVRTGIITTAAGVGSPFAPIDGVPATQAGLSRPMAVALDSAGNLFIADEGKRIVLKVDGATQVVYWFAGSAGPGPDPGDGGPAREAVFFAPRQVHVDPAGNVFIADAQGNRVRRIAAATGIVETVAGDGERYFGGDGGPADRSMLAGPGGIAVASSGDILFSDPVNGRVRSVDALTHLITTIAGASAPLASGNGDGGLASHAWLRNPQGIALDGTGNLFIAETEAGRVRRVDAATGIISTVAGGGSGGDGGPALGADLGLPVDVALDAGGNLYIGTVFFPPFTNPYRGRVRRVDAATGVITTVAGGGTTYADGIPAISTLLQSVSAIAFDGPGNLLIADRLDGRIRRVDALTGLISTVSGGGQSGPPNEGVPATSVKLGLWDGGLAPSLTGIAVGTAGNFYFPEPAYGRVRRVDAASGLITTVAGGGTGGDRGPAIGALIRRPSGVALEARGNLLVGDFLNLRVRGVGLVNHPAVAAAGSDLEVPCTGPLGTLVSLDASASTDPDSHPGTSDDIVTYEWFEDFGLPTQRLIAEGKLAPTTLPRGTHDITLNVVDRFGETSTDSLRITITDASGTDLDGDGISDLCDDCPGLPNPAQEDLDLDGAGDACDSCTDRDGDGFGNPGHPAGTCPPDNCPRIANPAQADADGDGLGDTCDPCAADPDGDRDGVCTAVDDCPAVPNTDQGDADRDATGDACDPCTDTDRDGFGDPGFPASLCARDNCPATYNPSQDDHDGNGIGDACERPQVTELSVTKERRHFDCRDTADLCCIDPPFCSCCCFPDTVQRTQADIDLVTITVRVGHAEGAAPIQRVLLRYEDPPPSLRPPGTGPTVISLEMFDAGSTPIGSDGYGPPLLSGDALAGDGIYTRRFYFSTSTNVDSGSCVEDTDFGQLGGIFETQGTGRVIDPSDLIPFGFEAEATDTRGNFTATGQIPLPIQGTFGEFSSTQQACGQPSGHGGCFSSNRAPSPVAGANISAECTSSGGTSVFLNGSASTDPDSTPGTQDDIASYEWFENYDAPSKVLLGTGPTLSISFGLGSHTVTLRVTDVQGASATDSLQVNVVDTVPPSISCPANLTEECAGEGAAPVQVRTSASDTCDGSATVFNDRTSNGGDASGQYPLGETLVTFRSRDASGNEASCRSIVAVRDTQPPTLGLAAEPLLLWPPNHRLVDVAVAAAATDRCGPVQTVLTGITSNEPEDAPGEGDGHSTGDIQDAGIGSEDFLLRLRAERDGDGEGRIYTIAYSATDLGGNMTAATFTVAVPHDQEGGVEPIAVRAEEEGGRSVIGWTSTPGGLFYHLIRGVVGNIDEGPNIINLGEVSCLGTVARNEPLQVFDSTLPAPGQVFFYLVSYDDDRGCSSFGSESAGRPRLATSGDCVP